jgi:hypothetical protein
MGSATNVQRRRLHSEMARAKAAEARAASRARQRRRRLGILLAAVIAVLAVIGAIVATAVLREPGGGSDATSPRRPAPQELVDDVTQVPASVIDTVGLRAVTAVPKPVADEPLVSDGKPQVLYIGAEYCPFCAAERWALVQALSRFGTWKDLSLTTSGRKDVFPGTATFTFYGASYTSDYLSFVGKERATNEEAATAAGYQPLDELTDAEAALFYGHTNAYPFTDFGGRYVAKGAGFDPSVLHELTAAQIAAAMNDPRSDVARAAVGSANTLTAVLCDLTDGQPAAVCTTPGVTAATAVLSDGRG